MVAEQSLSEFLASDLATETPISAAYFEVADATALKEIDNVYAAMAREAYARTEVAQAKRALAQCEAAWWRDNRVPGTNAEQRSQALELLRKDDRAWNGARATLERWEAELGDAQRALEQARELRSLAKKRMDFAIQSRRMHAED